MLSESQSTIKQSYANLRSIYVGAAARRNLTPGEIAVLIEGDEDFSVSGTLNAQGVLSGMAKLYTKLALQVGDEITFTVPSDGTLVVAAPSHVTRAPTVSQPRKTVFEEKGLKHVHLEVFRPENLDNWEPETETDVYLAFGVLQGFTDYQYCCGASTAVLAKLGADYTNSSKPDAILIDRTTDQYVLAEWKMKSSAFKSNHLPDDVDVLVCWHDDEPNRGLLPHHTLALHGIAKTAAVASLGDG